MVASQTSIEKGAKLIKKYTTDLTTRPGVYKMIDLNEKILYIGKAKNLVKRVKSYTNPNKHSYRIKKMISETKSMQFTITNSEAEALLLEANLIKKNKPRYNIAMRDDKSFPKILVNKEHEFPRLMKYRGDNKIQGEYYGPFASAGAVNRTIDTLQKAFLIRTCSDSVYMNRSRPCLLHQINRCSAPCTGEISKKNYDILIKDLDGFMNGKGNYIKDKIFLDMEKQSKSFNYENAAILRDRLETITKIQSQQTINNSKISDADIFGVMQLNNIACVQVFFFRAGQNWGNREYFPIINKIDSIDMILDSFIAQFYTTHPCPSNIIISTKIPSHNLLEKALSEKNSRKVVITFPHKGEKFKLIQKVLMNTEQALKRKMNLLHDQKTLLEELKNKLSLRKIPKRIEIYDNSHIQGSLPVGAMVVAGVDGFEKKHYRKFNIKSELIEKGDDYGMMREMLERRFAKISEIKADENIPDLLVIDGGLGQLNVALEIIKKNKLNDIEVISISKDKNRRFGNEKIHLGKSKTIILEKNDPLLYFLQRIRDEAHRFAIGSHRHRRTMQLKNSKLDDIEGIGSKRKQQLIKYFGSMKSIQEADYNDIVQVPGINEKLARDIFSLLHNE